MTSSYVAFDPDMLHSPLPFGIQARWQGSVGYATSVLQQPWYLSVHSLSAAYAAHHLVAHPVGSPTRLVKLGCYQASFKLT